MDRFPFADCCEPFQAFCHTEADFLDCQPLLSRRKLLCAVQSCAALLCWLFSGLRWRCSLGGALPAPMLLPMWPLAVAAEAVRPILAATVI